MDYLNEKNLKSLHFENSLGTDLTIELPENHLWAGGAEYTQGGVEFIANMPTEKYSLCLLSLELMEQYLVLNL